MTVTARAAFEDPLDPDVPADAPAAAHRKRGPKTPAGKARSRMNALNPHFPDAAACSWRPVLILL
jgi:hypothetical protein